MAKLFHAAARLTLGATLAGLVIGACEATYWHAPKGYAALGYSALFGLLAALLAPCGIALYCLRPHPMRRMTTTPFGRGAFVVVLCFGAFVLTRFILWRDVYVEAPDKHIMALAWGAVAGGLVAIATCGCLAIVRIVGGTFDTHSPDDVDAMPKFAARLVWLPSLSLWVSFGLCALWGMSADEAPSVLGPVVTLAPSAVDTATQATAPAPSVILVVADALRADALSSFGAPSWRGHKATPNLAQFAQGARQFDNAVANASWTKPALASILTSLLPSGHQTMAKAAVLPDTATTLPQVLQQHDISTSAVVTNYNLARTFGFARGFDSFEYLTPARYLGAPPAATRLSGYNFYRLLRERYFAAGRRSDTFYRSAAEVNRAAFDLFDRIQNAPFFMWLHYMEPHDPYFSRDGRSYARVADPHPTAAAADVMHDAYRDGVGRLDTGFGQLWDGLVARGLDKRTLVIVVADHGEEFGEHGGFYHGTSLYEPLVHIPLMMRGPRVAPGRTRTLAQHIDLAPTIAGYLGAPKAAAWLGRDLLDAAQAPPRVAQLEEDHEGNRLRALRGGSPEQMFKHITANADNPRGLPTSVLFDVAADPQEMAPLSETQSAPIIDSLAAFAHLQQEQDAKRAAPPKVRKRTQPLSADGEAQLRALGYVE